MLLVVVAAALMLRIWSASQCGIVNPDAAIYIHQARAMHYGEWDELGSGSVSFVTPYPALIAAANVLVGDWIIAARTVSIVFSMLTLIVLYPLVRTFFDRDISLLLLLIYAFNPLFVSSGVDVIKDPASWFFVVAGMLAFVKGTSSCRPILVLSSSVLFLFAAWMRIEALIFLLGSGIFLLLERSNCKGKSILMFLAPLLAGFLLGVAALFLTQRSEILWARLGEIGPRMEMSIGGYQSLRHGLRALSADPPPGMPPEYFDQLRSITWLVGIGVVVRNTIEAYYAPFFALFLLGLVQSRGGWRGDPRAKYFSLLLGLLAVFFYVFIFSCWVLEQRWLGTAVLASFFFVGQGLVVVRNFAVDRFRLQSARALAALAVIIAIVALPKTVLPREQDKAVFLEISAAMAPARMSANEIEILAPAHAIRWLSLYANKDVQGAPYPDEFNYSKQAPALAADSYEAFVENLRSRKIRYVLWAENHWPKNSFDLLVSYKHSDLKKIGEWRHRDTGSMVLFEVRNL